MNSNAYIGTGWKFPPVFSKAGYSAEMVSGNEDIRESLYILLFTIPGERIMLPEYGAGLNELLYENLNNTLLHRIREQIRLAILYYEPRITVDDLAVTRDNDTEGKVWVEITYTVSASNERANIVYPFYLREGTLVRMP